MARPRGIENRTELILDAARELFGRYGFERTTIEDIAKHTGIGKGSIYLEFQSKQEILMAVIERFVQEMRAYFAEHLEGSSPPYLESLERLLLAHVQKVHERATSQIHTPDVLVHTSRQVKSRFQEHFLFFQSCVVDLLRRAADNGEIRAATNFNSVADTILLGMSSLCPPYLRNSTVNQAAIPSREQLRDEACLLISLLIDGVRHKYGC